MWAKCLVDIWDRMSANSLNAEGKEMVSHNVGTAKGLVLNVPTTGDGLTAHSPHLQGETSSKTVR